MIRRPVSGVVVLLLALTLSGRAHAQQKAVAHQEISHRSAMMLVNSPSSASAKAVSPRKITAAEAEALVVRAVESTRGARGGFVIESDSSEPPYKFEVRAANPTHPTQPLIDFFFVDADTGDVWSDIVCKEYTSPSLKKLQQTIRKRIGLTDQEYHKLRKPGPKCD